MLRGVSGCCCDWLEDTFDKVWKDNRHVRQEVVQEGAVNDAKGLVDESLSLEDEHMLNFVLCNEFLTDVSSVNFDDQWLTLLRGSS